MLYLITRLRAHARIQAAPLINYGPSSPLRQQGYPKGICAPSPLASNFTPNSGMGPRWRQRARPVSRQLPPQRTPQFRTPASGHFCMHFAQFFQICAKVRLSFYLSPDAPSVSPSRLRPSATFSAHGCLHAQIGSRFSPSQLPWRSEPRCVRPFDRHAAFFFSN